MTNSATAAPKGGATRRTIVSAVFGNFMEYIDFGWPNERRIPLDVR